MVPSRPTLTNWPGSLASPHSGLTVEAVGRRDAKGATPRQVEKLGRIGYKNRQTDGAHPLECRK